MRQAKSSMSKLKIEEIVIVEGRDDTRAVLEAVDCKTIETHGFGITKETYSLIEKAYKETGIIIFTDPDHSGEEIRRKLKEKFPNSKEAFLVQKNAIKKGDIGIENGKAEDIKEAILKARITIKEKEDIFTLKDLTENNLEGNAKRREALGNILGIGYGNNKTFLKKLNAFNISRDEFLEGLKKI